MIEYFLSEFTLFASKAGQVFLTVQQASLFLREADDSQIEDAKYLSTLAGQSLKQRGTISDKLLCSFNLLETAAHQGEIVQESKSLLST